MVNVNEEKVRRRYEKLRYSVLHEGWPDFIIFKYGKKNKKFSDVQFVEVKTGRDRLSYEQAVCKKVLESLGLNYKLIHNPSSKEDRKNKTRQIKTKQNKTKQDKSIQIKATQNKARQHKTSQNKSTQDNTTQIKSKPIHSIKYTGGKTKWN